MNVDLVFEISALALAIARDHATGEAEGPPVEDTLLDIIHMAADAYEEHTGRPVHPREIRYEDRI